MIGYSIRLASRVSTSDECRNNRVERIVGPRHQRDMCWLQVKPRCENLQILGCGRSRWELGLIPVDRDTPDPKSSPRIDLDQYVGPGSIHDDVAPVFKEGEKFYTVHRHWAEPISRHTQRPTANPLPDETVSVSIRESAAPCRSGQFPRRDFSARVCSDKIHELIGPAERAIDADFLRAHRQIHDL